MPRGDVKFKEGSAPKKQRVHCRGAKWLLCFVSQLMRLTLKHLISEKKAALLEREDH